ncbi:MAG: TM2 domain-containing protein [[Clostridium] leptum]
MYCRHCGAEMNSMHRSARPAAYPPVPAVLITPTAVPNASLVRYSVPTAAASLHRNRHSRPIIRIPHSSPIKTRHIRGGSRLSGAWPRLSAAGLSPVGTPLKSKMAAGLLGIFLGAFGVHNFYLGYTTKAVIQLCLTLLSCGILSFASGIWGFIEGIMLLTGSINVDGNGMPLQQ